MPRQDIPHRRPEGQQQQQQPNSQQQQHNSRTDFGLDAAPSLEELGADPSTLTSNLMQVNVLSEREIRLEAEASESNLRQSIKNDNLIPAVGTRPVMALDNFSSRPSPLLSNVLDEVRPPLPLFST
jgi:hypothetical protein